MTPEDVLKIFKQTGALLEGHFVYTSGRHGHQFLQAARVLQYPDHTEALCKALAENFRGMGIELVVGPATGGIILAYETARHLGVRGVFTEKEGKDGMVLKRGFTLKPGTRCLVVEDITTTGGSVRKAANHVRDRGAVVVGIGALIDRSAGEARFDVPFRTLAAVSMESWPPEECPLCKAGEPLVEPDDIVID